MRSEPEGAQTIANCGVLCLCVVRACVMLTFGIELLLQLLGLGGENGGGPLTLSSVDHGSPLGLKGADASSAL